MKEHCNRAAERHFWATTNNDAVLFEGFDSENENSDCSTISEDENN